MKTPCHCENCDRRAAVHVASSMMLAAKTFSEEGTQGTAAASAAFKNQSHAQKHATKKNGYGLATGIDAGIEELEARIAAPSEKTRTRVEKPSRTFGNGQPRR